MTLNGAIMQLVELRESSMIPEALKPCFDKVIETISECEELSAQPEHGMNMAELGTDAISRQAAIEALCKAGCDSTYCGVSCPDVMAIENLPSAQPTLYGYPVEHLAIIARILQKEHLPPERVAEMLSDVVRTIEMVRDEYEKTLRKVMEGCTI